MTAWPAEPDRIDAIGVYTYDGQVEERIETLPCDREVIFNWLGY